ncbi:MAG: DNA sulfur modification protein DndB [Candidatus Binatus sp.]|uniref:DNA sulfur modification protein DndB n=1 Tax=Candidatus Binatus sp. TaxID=2811406 RepID=UPI0027257B73|nr:DNA sulfur modification protein DndB [Candidatus Binatus sp.]MDO8432728.1 DNA sulfur modification protein DndB [Candidatus Binatus sp.]
MPEESQTLQTGADSKLNETDGHMVAGVKLDDVRFLGRVRASQLFQIAPDPRETENRKRVDGSKELQVLAQVRSEVQRMFVGAKAKNVPSYARYIVGVSKLNQDGLTPPIVLYSEEPLKTQIDSRGMGFIQIPWEQRLVAIDGETQLAARYEAANIDPDTKKDFVPVYICHGRDHVWASQCFHDLNALAVQPNAALIIAMDSHDPLTQITREIEVAVPFFKGRVNKVRRQLGKNDYEVVTITALRGACITLAEGIRGVQYGTRPVPVDEKLIPAIREVATEWLREVTSAIGPAMEDPQSLASAPAVLAAIGAVGHELLNLDAAERASKRQLLIERLSGVDWTRGKQWEGIAGKFTPKGNFSVGGSKETAYAVYSALNDPNSLGYKRIRHQAVDSVISDEIQAQP